MHPIQQPAQPAPGSPPATGSLWARTQALAPSHPVLGSAPRPRATPSAGDAAGVAMPARARLAPLLRHAASLDLDDEDDTRSLRASAARVTSQLARDAELPDHLVVDAQDSPAVVVRLLAVAWRHLVRVSPRPRPSP